VEGQNGIGPAQMAQVKLERLLGQQMNGRGVAIKRVEYQKVKFLRAL